MWPELEIGSSSAGPCRTPSATACRTGRPASGSRANRPTLGGRGVGGGLVLGPAPAEQQIDDADDDQRGDRVVDVVELVLPVVPVVARLLADEAEQQDPG